MQELRGRAAQTFGPGRAAKELAEAERGIRPRVIPGFVTAAPRGTKFLRDLGKQPPIVRKFLSEEPRLVQLQLEAMDPLKRAAHQRKFLSSLDKSFSKSPRISATDASAIGTRLESVFYDQPRLAQTIRDRLQQWVSTGERPGLAQQNVLEQIERRVEGFREQALPFAIPGAFLDPLTTAGSLATAYGIPKVAKKAGEAAKTRLGPFPKGSIRPGAPAAESARKALAAEKRAARRPRKKPPEATIPAPAPEAIRELPPPPPLPGGVMGYSPFGVGHGPGRPASPSPPPAPAPPGPPPELQIPFSAGRLPQGFRQMGPERAPPPPPPPMGGHIDITTQGGQLPSMLPNPAMPNLRDLLPPGLGPSPRPSPFDMGGVMPTSTLPPGGAAVTGTRPLFNPTFPGTFNPFAGDAPFFPPKGGAPSASRPTPAPRAAVPKPPGTEIASRVRAMNMLERRAFQTESMRDVLRLDRNTLRGARMETLNDDLRAIFVNNKTLEGKVRKAVGKWVNEGGSLSDHLRSVNAPKWLSGGLE